MRLRKAPKSGSQVEKSHAVLTEHECLLWKDVDELVLSSDKETVMKLFVQHVMKPLLGSQYVDSGVCCFLYYSLLDMIFLLKSHNLLN